MTANVFDFAARNHRAFVERETRRAMRQLDRLAGLRIIDLPAEPNADGTRQWGDWSALTHLPARAK